ncbi:DUF5682 family protein, partial [Actinocorallia lasiicapitis]
PLRTAVDGLVVRVCLALPRAAASLDDDAARTLLDRIAEVDDSLAVLADAAHTSRWTTALLDLLSSPTLHGLLEGRLTRLLSDAGHLHDLPARMSRAVSPGVPPARAAAWLDGFLSPGILVLLHDTPLLRLLDTWLTSLPPDSFTTTLPLLRRVFAAHSPPERQALTTRLTHLTTPDPSPTALHHPRATQATTTALLILT